MCQTTSSEVASGDGSRMGSLDWKGLRSLGIPESFWDTVDIRAIRIQDIDFGTSLTETSTEVEYFWSQILDHMANRSLDTLSLVNCHNLGFDPINYHRLSLRALVIQGSLESSKHSRTISSENSRDVAVQDPQPVPDLRITPHVGCMCSTSSRRVIVSAGVKCKSKNVTFLDLAHVAKTVIKHCLSITTFLENDRRKAPFHEYEVRCYDGSDGLLTAGSLMTICSSSKVEPKSIRNHAKHTWIAQSCNNTTKACSDRFSSTRNQIQSKLESCFPNGVNDQRK